MSGNKKVDRMIKEYFPVLSETNSHPRDENIVLNYESHIYTIKGYPSGSFKSVTKWKDERFPEFDADLVIEKMRSKPNFGETKYSGMTTSEIKSSWSNNATEAAELGRWLHRDIEGFLNDNSLSQNYTNGDLFSLHELVRVEDQLVLLEEESNAETKESIEWGYFMHFVRDYGTLIPYRTEWMIYHEEYRIVGTIDCVYKFQNKSGETRYAIFDWKRSGKGVSRSKYYNEKPKEKSLGFMKNNSYWQYAIQLNLYRIILMDHYDIRTDHMYILRLHPGAKDYQLVRMPVLDWALRPLLERKDRPDN
jgi:hypothetical protein